MQNQDEKTWKNFIKQYFLLLTVIIYSCVKVELPKPGTECDVYNGHTLTTQKSV